MMLGAPRFAPWFQNAQQPLKSDPSSGQITPPARNGSSAPNGPIVAQYGLVFPQSAENRQERGMAIYRCCGSRLRPVCHCLYFLRGKEGGSSGPEANNCYYSVTYYEVQCRIHTQSNRRTLFPLPLLLYNFPLFPPTTLPFFYHSSVVLSIKVLFCPPAQFITTPSLSSTLFDGASLFCSPFDTVSLANSSYILVIP
jgi:hypothetical protein